MGTTDSTTGKTPEPEVVYDFDPNNLPPEYLQAVGLVAMASAQTESIMQDLIGGLLGIDNIEALALSAHMAAPLKDHVARALIEMNATDAVYVDLLDDLLDAVAEALGKRNTIVHNPLLRHPDTGEIFSHRLKARGSLQLELRPVTVDEMREDARLVYEAGIAVIQFMGAFGLGSPIRTRPIWSPLDRSKKARAVRQAARNGKTAK
jgi:hypothetical protein